MATEWKTGKSGGRPSFLKKRSKKLLSVASGGGFQR
jgi:hypothetical protein